MHGPPGEPVLGFGYASVLTPAGAQVPDAGKAFTYCSVLGADGRGALFACA
jgi:hypothetical protein